MPRNNEGEFELVLGNKQLLSLFFLVAVLFAVFFSLGYMVGKSVGPTSTIAAQPASPAPAASGPDVPPPLVAAPLETAPPAPGSSPQPDPEAGEEQPPATVSGTRPARGEALAAATPAPAREPREVEAPPAAAAPGPVNQELHLQLAAVRVREDAEALAESLRRKGYQVLLNSQAGDGWYRVMVGPFSDERSARDMKARLEKDGYKSILKRP